MSEPIHFALAQTWRLASTTNIAVVDEDGSWNAPLVAGYYRTFLCETDTAGSGTATDPWELLWWIGDALGGNWTVAMRPNGKIRLTYSGTGTGTLTFPAPLANLTGFAVGTTPAIASGGTLEADYQPTHINYALAFGDDTGWMPMGAMVAAAKLPQGSVVAWSNGLTEEKRTFSVQWLPKDAAASVSEDSTNTPAFTITARRFDSGADEPDQDCPWSWQDMLNVQTTQQCAIAWGNFQELVAGDADQTFDVVWCGPEMLSREQRPQFAVASGYDKRRHINGFVVWAAAHEVTRD